MREFVVYTVLRLLLLVGTFAIVVGVWFLLADEVNLFWAVVLSFVISGVGSYFLLDRQRSAFASRVEARAERASKAFEEMKAKEDAD